MAPVNLKGYMVIDKIKDGSVGTVWKAVNSAKKHFALKQIALKGANDSVTSLQSQITDFEARMTQIQNQLTLQFVTVNTTLQQMPLLLAQINSQLG